MLHSFDTKLEKLNGFETDFLRILYYDLPQNYAGTYQSQGYTRVCTILEGEKHISVREKEFSYDQSKTLILPSYSKVYMTISKPTKALVFELNDSLIQKVAKNAQPQLATTSTGSFNELLLGKKDQTIHEDLTQLIKISSKKGHKERFLIDLYAQKLVYDMLQTNLTGNLILNQTFNPMQRAIDFMKKHLSEPLQMSAIAKSLNMSESSFSHAFKKEMGITPQKYMHQLKLDRAVELLSEQSVTETALELGYENPSHFIKLFKTAFGVTPKQFQLNQI